MGVEGITAAVTGASGFVGKRLVEMLLERGAASVVALDLTPWPENNGTPSDPRVRFVPCDITDAAALNEAFRGVDCVWHMAALVGPFHPRDRYYAVNYQGTLNVIAACKWNNVRKLVASSSPSTRFDGGDVSGKTEDELPIRAPGEFLEPYAETKALGEIAVSEACGDDFLTVNIAPHQVYGPHDPIFLPNLLEAMRTGKLRVFGDGENEISVVFNDNYCHSLILAFDALYPGSPALGKFYIVTDGGKVKFWQILDDAGVYMGYQSLYSKAKLPVWLLLTVAYIGLVIGRMTGRSFKLTPFTVRMMTIDRWFVIDAVKKDLGYEPLYDFDTAWTKTKEWFRAHPEHLARAAQKTSQNRVFSKSKDV